MLSPTGFETLFINRFGGSLEELGYTATETVPGEFVATKGANSVALDIHNGRIEGWTLNGQVHAAFAIHPRDEQAAADRLAMLESATGPGA